MEGKAENNSTSMCAMTILHSMFVLVSNVENDRRHQRDEMTHTNAFADLPEDVSLRRILLVHTAAKYEHSCGGADVESMSPPTDLLDISKIEREIKESKFFFLLLKVCSLLINDFFSGILP